jgi:hypothetical protein
LFTVDRKQRERVREEGEGTYRRIDDHGDFLADEERESFIFVIEDDQLSTLVDDVDSYSKASTLPDDDFNWRRNLVNFYENKSGILNVDISTNSWTNQPHSSGYHDME